MRKWIYRIWIAISSICIVYILSNSFPDYQNNEFPLLADFQSIVFVIIYFLMVWLIIHVLKRIIIHTRLTLLYGLGILVVFNLILIAILPHRFIFKLIGILIGNLMAFIYFVITEMLYQITK